MPTIRKLVAVPIGGAPIYPLTGDQFEYLPFDARVQFAIIEKSGVATAVLQATVYSGSDVLQQAGPVTVKAVGGTAIFPDDFLLDDEASAGERLNVVLTNSGTGAAASVECVVIITPS